MLFADIEGDGFLDDITRIWVLVIGDEEGRVAYADQLGYRPLREGLKRLKSANKVVFHNGWGYDYWAINKLYPDTLRPDQIVDSLILCRMKWPESNHSLDLLGERVGLEKLDFTDFSKFTDQMVTYCLRDVEILQHFWPKIEGYFNAYKVAVECEHEVGRILALQEHHGFKLNVAKAQALERTLRGELVAIERKLQSVFPPIVTPRFSAKTGKPLKPKVEVFNPGSRQQIAKRLFDKYGWKPNAKTETGQPKIDENTLKDCPGPEAELMLEYFRVSKMIGQLADGDNAWLKLVDKDGYVHGRVNQCGARTHRMSHFRPNMAQVDSDPRMRDCWEADPGDVLVGCDADSLELRMLAHYLAKHDGGEFGRALLEGKKEDGTDAHSRNQKAAGLYSRDNAKTLIYALLYGAGDAKLGKIVRQDAFEAGITLKGSDTALGREVRQRLLTGVAGLDKLVNTVKKLHNKNGWLPGLDGRPIPSASEHSALNTLLQSAGAIVMKHALVIFARRVNDYIGAGLVKFCANVHDEWQLSVHPDFAEEVGIAAADSIREAGVVLGVRCPLKGNYDIGKTWQETH